MSLRDWFPKKTSRSSLFGKLEESDDVARLVDHAQVCIADGRLTEALSVYRLLQALKLESWMQLSALASLSLQLGLLYEAIETYNRLVALRPLSAEFHFKRGNAHNSMGNWNAALADYDQTIALDSKHAMAYCNRGTVLERQCRWPEALASYDRGLAENPSDAFAHYNRASSLRRLDRFVEAIASYDRAIALKADYVEAYVNLGRLLHELGRPDQAADSYARALQLCSLSQTRASPGLKPEQKYLLGQKRYAQMQICDWEDIEADLEEIKRGLRDRLPVTLPFPVLAMLDNLALQRAAAEIFIREEGFEQPAQIRSRSKASKIRVGYFSSDFRLHPVANLMVGVFEQHDRSRFELTAFAFGPESADAVRTRISKAFDRFIDVRQSSDSEVVALARDMGIDIAVNLNGFTENSRTGIFAMRAAPSQISYLGYPGTMGAGFMDYLIADSVVIPADLRHEYAEKIIYLPGTFMPFDSSYEISEKHFTRKQLDLPSEGFIFCCFNNNFKLTPLMFDCWMRILDRAKNSVLWLGNFNPMAAGRLRREASRRGIDDKRLIFAIRMDSLPEHLARLRTADLFLDTFPYNAHATALDALWAGLPLVTLSGSSFASRVGASLLEAAGLPQLVTRSVRDYEDLAVALALDTSRLEEFRAQLVRSRSGPQLFDTSRYTQSLEQAFEAVFQSA